MVKHIILNADWMDGLTAF